MLADSHPILKAGLAFHTFVVKQMHADGNGECSRNLAADLCYGFGNDAAAVFKRAAVFVGSAVTGGAYELMEHKPVCAMKLNAVAAGIVSVLGGICKCVFDELNVILGHFTAGSKAASLKLRSYCACRHGDVAFVELGAGLTAGVVELNKYLSAELVDAVSKNVHCVAVIERAQEGLAGHRNAAVLGADNADKADDDKAGAALCLCGVVLNAASGHLARSLTEAVVHR